jgi:alkaline phosphatase
MVMSRSENAVNRRGFLLGAGALASVAGSLSALEAAQAKKAQPRNIIFMVADGMSSGVIPLADHFSQRVRGKGLLWRELMSRPGASNALVDMSSLNSITTDSSAASSSWGSGSRIFNAAVNVLPDGTELTPVATIARDLGRRIGLVTTVTVTHATPAGFVAATKSRSGEEDIASQYLKKTDVVLGGGRNFFQAATRSDKADMLGSFKQAGFSCLASRGELMSLMPTLSGQKSPSKVLGLFTPGYIPFSLDRNSSRELQQTIPTLAEMTNAALAALKTSPKGFLLQVEAGRVDMAAHNNDAAALMWEQLAFDEAIEAVVKFAGQNPETLIVITTDHGNSNPGMGGKPSEIGSGTGGFDVLAKAKYSFEEGILPKLKSKEKLPASTVQDAVRETCGYEFTADEVEAVRSSAAGVKKLSLNGRLDKLVGILGEAASNHNGIGWVSADHTSDYSLLTALGPGSELFRGQMRNTMCFDNMVTLMGSKFRNPSMTPEQARKFLHASTFRYDGIHWA